MELKWQSHWALAGLHQITINRCSIVKGLKYWGYTQDFEVLPPNGDDVYRFDTLEEAVEFTKQWQ